MQPGEKPDPAEVGSAKGFTERRWHWWLSRIGIPIFVATLALSGLLYVNRDKLGNASTEPDAPNVIKRAAGGGWGPLREMYTSHEPSPTAVFNSISDNPFVGDTRNFVQCRIADDPNNKYADQVPVIDRLSVIDVYIYIENSSTKPEQAIHNARMQLGLTNAEADEATINVNLWGSNAIRVWDGCRVLGSGRVGLSYKPGSAVIHLKGVDGPSSLSDGVVRGQSLLPAAPESVAGDVPADKSNYGYIELQVEAFLAS